MEQKGMESIIHDHDGDLWVTTFGWVDVGDSVCIYGDRCRRHIWLTLTLLFLIAKHI